MELGQDAVMGFARAVAEPREARRSTSDATVTRVEDGVAYVALPGGEGDTPVAQSAASVEVGDAVTVEWRGNALHLTGNVSAPSVGGSYVQQRISPVEAEAQVAAEAAARAGEAADSAAVAAGNAQSSANAAAAAAGSAQASADNANEYAARALGNLSTVQSVTETLAWITQHGTMALTADTEPDPTHVYFVADAGGDYVVGSAHYSLVIEPVAADMATYYELTIDESLNNYVGTHLSLTAEGLWLLPASSGAYRILIATGAGTTYTEAGTYIIDANGGVVAQFGTATRIGHAAESHVDIDYHSMRAIDKEGTTYFHVSDLRDRSGSAEIVDTWIGLDVILQPFLSFEAVPSGWHEEQEGENDEPELVPEYDYEVTIDDVVVASGIDRGADSFVFDSPKDEHGDAIAFTAASVVTATYKTEDPNAKAFTFGPRGVGKVGALSVAEGFGCMALAAYSHAEGNGTKAAGRCSHAEGENTTASYDCSHAEGYATSANLYSHAEGYETSATIYSHAEGLKTQASGAASHAQNRGTIARAANQTALGKYNEEDANGDYALIIGNGTDATHRSNALTVDWDGVVDLGPMAIGGDSGCVNIHASNASPSDETPSASLYGLILALFDSDDELRTYLRHEDRADGKQGLLLETRRIVGGSNVYNNLQLLIDASGNRSVVVNDAAAWRNALSVGHYTAATALPLASGCVAYNANGTPMYAKDGHVVSVWGTAKPTAEVAAGDTLTIGTLPTGYRPSSGLSILCQGSGTAKWQLSVATNGTLTAQRYSNGTSNVAMPSGAYLPFTVTFITATT